MKNHIVNPWLITFFGIITAVIIGFGFAWLMIGSIGCSHTSFSGVNFKRSALNDNVVESANAYAIVTGADMQSNASREQLKIQRRAFNECVKQGNRNCHMMGYWGGMGFGYTQSWWWPDTYQNDSTFYRGISR